jgi:hypothetical protein
MIAATVKIVWSVDKVTYLVCHAADQDKELFRPDENRPL